MKVSVFFCLAALFLTPVLLNGQVTDSSVRSIKTETRETISSLQSEARALMSTTTDPEKDLPQALKIIRKSEQLSHQLKNKEGIARSQVLYAQYWRLSGDNEKGKSFAEKAENSAETLHFYSVLGTAYQELYEYYDWYTQLDTKTKYLEKALEAFRKKSSNKEMADMLSLASEHYNYTGDNTKAIACGEEAIALYKSAGEKDLINIYRIMGYNYSTAGNLKKALEYSLIGARYGEEHGNLPFQMSYINSQISGIYHQLKEPDRSREYLVKALENAKQSQDTTQIYSISSNIVHNFISLNRYRDAERFLKKTERDYKTDAPHLNLTLKVCFTTIYTKLKEYPAAARYCSQMMAIVNQYQDRLPPHIVFNARHTATSFYFKSGKYAEAKKMLQSNLPYAEKSPGYINKKTVYTSAFKIDSVLGNYKDAFRYYQLVKKIDDSLFNIDKNKQLSQLQLQYETEKKDKDIQLKNQNIRLLTKEGELQKATVAKVTFTRNLTFAAIILLLLIAVILYKGYRNKQLINRKLEKQREEIYHKNVCLSKLVEEKEWLVREIHHRVKNNLQIVMSLLSTQSFYLKDEAALTAIQDSQHRVHSMSLIHQKLYQSDNMAAIAMQVYIHELIAYLKDSFDTGKIVFQVNVDDMELDVSQAVPIGLILNEAITNAIKYAFKDITEAIIRVSLKMHPGNSFELIIADNGAGLPQNFDLKKVDSLGMSLMQGLSGDLEGQFEIFNDHGTFIRITFVHNHFEHETHLDYNIENRTL